MGAIQTMVNERRTLPLFLYGTLRQGASNHGLIAPYVDASAPARVWGQLYRLPAGYPALTVPPMAVLAHGTADPDADAATAAMLDTAAPARPRPLGDWEWIPGDLVWLRDPEHSLPPVDAYEAFRPGHPSLYIRALVLADTGQAACASWTYIRDPEPNDRRIGTVWVESGDH